MAFNRAQLLTQLQQLPPGGGLYLACSGGLDSCVLLHALATLREELNREIHVLHADHGLQADSPAWSQHCEALCKAWGISFRKFELQLEIPPGQSLEAVARAARYAGFAEAMQDGDVLLTAHHADDQAETVLLQMLRGAGVSGLAGMPMLKSWHKGWLARPLLPFSRQQLERYALDHQLQWMEDNSNRDVRFSRNLLRRQIIPELKKRWPGLLKTINRSALHCASAAGLIEELAATDWHDCAGANDWRLSIPALDRLSRTRRENLLRYWIRQQGLALPNTHKVRRILEEVLPAAGDAHPLVKWQGAELRRFADEIYLMPPLPSPVPEWQTSWDGLGALQLPAGLGELRIDKAGMGIDELAWNNGKVQVGFRSIGLKCKPAGRHGSRSFKRLCQDLQIPAWRRPLLPLLLVDGKLAAVADYCVCEPLPAQAIHAIQWSRESYLA